MRVLSCMIVAAFALSAQTRADDLDAIDMRIASATLFRDVKAATLKPDGDEYFKTHVQDAVLPRLRVAVVSSEPLDHPRTVIVAVTDDSTPELKLTLQSAASRPIAKGSVIDIEGAAHAYTAVPFMLELREVKVIRVDQRPAPKHR